MKKAVLAGRWLRSRFKGGALILGYHRISENDGDPYQICVSPKNFAEQMKVLAEIAHPISLDRLVDGINHADLPKRAVVITLDDGYVDNYDNARPILERFEIPATMFVTTGYLGREFWWDELADLFQSVSKLPDQLLIEIQGHSIQWQRDYKLNQRNGIDEEEVKNDLLQTLYQRLLILSDEQIQESLDRLYAWAGVDRKPNPAKRTLSPTEIVELAEGDLIYIGSHSHTHPLLASLPENEQQFEIQHSKSFLEQLIGREVVSFSYPNGSCSDRVRENVKKAGYKLACASFNDVAHQRSDRYSLPRFWIPDLKGNDFSRWLYRWLA